MQNPELITADDLNAWPDTNARDAQENFPRLIRYLLLNTPGVSAVSVRAGNGVSVPGYDGVAQSDGTASVLPAGSLLFEFGTSGEVGTKASDDYRKRAKKDDAASHIFLFMTPRRWSGKQKWLEKRRSEGIFADVWALDADDLEAWLEKSPASHYRISEHLGRQPDDAQTLEHWWDSFHRVTQPTLPLGLFTAGRKLTRDQLRKMLDEAPRSITIQADWCNDCFAFIYASLAAGSEDELSALDQSVIIIKSSAAWKRVARQPGRSILIPTFDNAEKQLALDSGHHVLQIIDRERVPLEAADLQLPRVSRHDVQVLLSDFGINFQKAGDLAGLARRNMPSFVRALTRDASIRKPVWATDDNAPMLAALTLFGAWDDDNERDRQAIATLAGTDYDMVAVLCQRLADGTDRVMSRAGSAWRFASLEEAFRCLSANITDGVMEQWKQLAIDILCEANWSYELTQAASNIRYSEELKGGVARSLAMIGSIAASYTQSDKLTDSVIDIASQLLNQAAADDTGCVWNLIAPRLPSLAEAAPQHFVDIVINSLAQETSSLLRAFNAHSGGHWFHPHLLWALEVLAWSEDYFDDAIECLALLATNQADDKQRGNRPDGSLAAILCGWANFTTVPSDKKLAALDSVKQISPDVGWHLLFALWPDWTTITPPATPRFRANWCPLTDAPVLQHDWNAYRRGLVERALTWSDVASSNLEQLVNHINIGVLPEDRANIIHYLDELSSSQEIDDDGRYLVSRTLRELAIRHAHHRADWSLPDDEIERLLALSDKWQPASPVLRHLYLFNYDPGLLDCPPHLDIDDYEQKVETRRQEALGEILTSSQAIENLEELASRAVASQELGWMLAEQPELDFWDIVHWADSPDRKLATVVGGYLYRALRQRGASWLQAVLDDPRLTAAQRAAVLRCVPAESGCWEVVSRNQADEDAYWRTAEMRVFPSDRMTYAIERLAACGRAWDAIDSVSLSILSARQEGVTTDLTADVLIGLLYIACAQESTKISSLSYEVGKVLDYIVELKADQEHVARLEFLLYPLLDHHREPMALNCALATDADLFVKLMKVMYSKDTIFGLEHSVACRIALRVVDNWHGFPGVAKDGVLDTKAMQQWVESARQGFAAADLANIGDHYIGRVLANSPEEANGTWPLAAVCELIDEVRSEKLDEGFIAGMCRGLMSGIRSIYEGGKQEREQAQRYRTWSKQIRSTSRHTARLLGKAAEQYEAEAKRQDMQTAAWEDEV
ncbi:hypothetical protein [Actinomyces bowdenii]|uniref:Uncharacterized protein n=1 Tax=Actinomyces bowdenii TaxID=131109 RepID=A0A3P1V4Y2_9ACTO|nr:hypothetical protein [Actinomyces bowdenii]RRD29284.1 hypothetical protein EII10_07185 [Actinomyces bowdenii]